MSISRLLYMIKKAKCMSTPEIAFRLHLKLSQTIEKQRYRRESRKCPADFGEAASKKLAKHFFSFASTMVQGADETGLKQVQKKHPAIYSRLLADNSALASSFHQGRWQLFERSVDLTGSVEWHQDPDGTYRWERRFFTDLKIYNLEDGTDVKYVWELNRHQFLVELARSWLLKNDAESAGHVKRLLRDWIAENPLNEGVNWTSALEAAMRTINWLHTLAAMKDWPGWTTDDKRTIAASLLDHGTYLNKNLSIYSSPYNHLVGEATALLLLSYWLQGCRHSEAWKKRAIRVLEQFGPAQFYSDGFTVEQAVGYHFYTLGFLIQAVLAIKRLGNPNDLATVEAILEKASLAGAAFKAPKSKWPPIGDLDSARSIPVYPIDYWDFSGLLSLMAVCLNSPNLKTFAGNPGAELYWLMGADGLSAWEQLETVETESVHALPNSGHIIASIQDSDASWLLFKAGPLGHGVHPDDTPSVAHGHLDALQVLLYLDGKPVLVDSGIPFYDGNPEWTTHFRTVAAHNTFQVEGAPWARPAGGLAWSNVGSRPELLYNLGESVQVMAGKMVLRPDVHAVRYVLMLDPIGVWITDRVVSRKPRTVDWYWQMPESRDPKIVKGDASSNSVSIECNDCRMIMNSTSPISDAGIILGKSDQPHGWVAHGYGQMEPSACIHFKTVPKERVLTTTFIGKELIPYTVQHDDDKLNNMTNGASSFPFIDSFPFSDIAWRIETNRGGIAIAAGVRGQLSAPWRHLKGLGGWPVAMITENVTPSWPEKIE